MKLITEFRMQEENMVGIFGYVEGISKDPLNLGLIIACTHLVQSLFNKFGMYHGVINR